MAYTKETCRAGKTIEIEKYYSYRTHAKGEKREKRGNPSPEWQKAANLRRAEKELRRLINANFKEGDYLLTLTYRPEERPADSQAMQKDTQRFIRRIRTLYRQKGQEARYIYVKEIGKRGAAHVHLLLNAAVLNVGQIEKAWEKGAADLKIINNRNYGQEPGQYRKIAAYFIKYAEKTAETEGRQVGKRWQGSQNLKRPEAKRQIISRSEHYSEDIRAPKGYHIEKESVRRGISEATGYKYLCYTLIQDG